MSAKKNYVAVPDSARQALPGARAVGPVDPQEKIEVTVYVRKNPAARQLPSPDEIGSQLPRERSYLSHEQAQEMFGADPADLRKVEEFARAHNLKVLKSNAAKRRVMLEGAAADIQQAFDVRLENYEHPEGDFRGRSGAVHVPAELDGVVTGVYGLDNRRVGRPMLRRGPQITDLVGGPTATAKATASKPPAHAQPSLPPNKYFPPMIASLYNFPANLDGSGQCIAIFAFNDNQSPGGYNPQAIQTYFEQVLGLPAPQITNVVVHGPGNVPGDDGPNAPGNDATGEVMLDIQMAGGVAPKAKLVMYFTTFTQRGWVDAIVDVVNDTANKPSVLSISYGNPEEKNVGSAFTGSAVKRINEAFQQASLQGLTVCCAAGDDGSRDQVNDGLAHVDFPASSPFVLGCGGTHLEGSGSTINREVVWNDFAQGGGAGGGGISTAFALPDWQKNANVPGSTNPGHRRGRGVPDVAGIAAPGTGVVIITVDGKHLHAIGGTSATAPMWAGLIARINQGLGAKVGFLNPLLYTRFSQGVLRDITQGNIGAYQARTGWDACTGLGSPDGTKLLNALSGQPVH
jgi:kumamolisin